MTLYLIGTLSLALLTSSLVDKDVWLRPVAGSPSPFPPALIWHVLRHRKSIDRDEKETQMCPPGCACARKLEDTDAGTEFAHGRSDGGDRESREAERVPGIRIPNVVERSSFIAIGLMGYEDDRPTSV